MVARVFVQSTHTNYALIQDDLGLLQYSVLFKFVVNCNFSDCVLYSFYCIMQTNLNAVCKYCSCVKCRG